MITKGIKTIKNSSDYASKISKIKQVNSKVVAPKTQSADRAKKTTVINKTSSSSSSAAALAAASSRRLKNLEEIEKRREKRRFNEKLTLNSYLNVCVDVGQINRAFNSLVRYTKPNEPVSQNVDVGHYNIILKGWARLSSVPQLVETRMHMFKNKVEPNAESYAYILLGYSKAPNHQKPAIRRIIAEIKSNNIDLKKIFQSTYLSYIERNSIKTMIRFVDPNFDDIFFNEPMDHKCKLLDRVHQLEPIPYDMGGKIDLTKLDAWAEHQRAIEWKPSVTIKSVAQTDSDPQVTEKYHKAWQKFQEIWRKSLTKALDDSLLTLQTLSENSEKIHLYPYLCSIDKNIIVNVLLDEIETNASMTHYSYSTNTLHLNLGNKIMVRYLRAKSVADGSHQEKQRLYTEYLTEYCKNPVQMGKMNSREFLQMKAATTKNYALYKDRVLPIELWPHDIAMNIGRFLYGLILREVRFDPEVAKNPNKEIKHNKLVHAFYTAYFRVKHTFKVKEEFRAHQDFEIFNRKACSHRLKFDYSSLPCSSPPLPWISDGFGGYLTNRSNLVRLTTFAEKAQVTKEKIDYQKLYPSLDALNALGLCPWIVNTEILDIVINMFKNGGNLELTVPIHESKMIEMAPKIAEDATRQQRTLFNEEKKRFDQKKREMYSLWRDCLYRLSIANHFRDRVFWFPHNMDFRGRTYPIPPHFNHLGSDLARSLLLFGKGRPLGINGLDWLKIHLINLVGKMKDKCNSERLSFANSILHTHILDSADNPLDGHRWWTDNENPWQVLACCMEIAKAIRSSDHTQYVSHFPVHQDGSCNGLQHYAALGRDYDGGLAVNLVPCDKPQDVYSRIVDLVEEMRQKDSDNGNRMAASLNGLVQRKVIKQTVMTTVYGVTKYGARSQIARQLVAKDFPQNDIWSASQYLANKTFRAIGKMFTKSQYIMSWFSECAWLIASSYKQLVSWETPLGFMVIQPYVKPNSNKQNRFLPDSYKFISKPFDPLALVNAPKQKNAFPPNYIHSLDSSHMMLTSLYCQQEGITFVSVHDCFWTHPSTVDTMNRICREQFVSLHSGELLKDLSDQFVKQVCAIDKDVKLLNSGLSPSLEDRKNSQNIEVETLETSERSVQKRLCGGRQRPKQQSGNLVHGDDPNVRTSGLSALDKIVDDDLSSLILVEDELVNNDDVYEEDDIVGIVDDLDSTLNDNSQDLIRRRGEKKIKSSLREIMELEAKRKSLATFKEVPHLGKLDLKSVLKSTYFFS